MLRFNKTLKATMKKKKITQSELAEHLGIDRSSVSNWWRGQNTPTLEMFVDIAEYLEVSTDYLLLGGDEDEIQDKSK